MVRVMRNSLVSGIVAATCCAWSVTAQQVEIKTIAGGVAISGQLLEFDDEVLTVRAQIGTIRIPRSMSICVGDACPPEAEEKTALLDDGQLTISASESIGASLLPRLVGGFAQTKSMAIEVGFDETAGSMVLRLGESAADPTVVKLSLSSTTRAFDDLLTGRAAIIVTSRRATASEAERFEAAGVGDIRNPRNETVIALDGLGIVVSPENGLTSLSIEDVVRIVSGEVTDWSEVGGPSGPISVHLPPNGEDAFEAFAEEILRPRRLRAAREAIRTSAGEQLSALVAADPRAIGLVPLSQSGDTRVLSLELSCGLLAEADLFSVKAEEYPLGRRIYMYQRNPGVRPLADDLFTYAQTPSGQSGVDEVGFFDQEITDRTVNQQGLRFVSAIVSEQDGAQLAQLQEMAAGVQKATRMSTTLRFNSGSSDLDTKALTDIDRLAAEINRPGFRFKEILLLGFTDNVGRGDVNQIVANDRAEEVRERLIAAIGLNPNGLALNTIGYGPIAPVGCNDEVSGREANRRVEVWVR